MSGFDSWMDQAYFIGPGLSCQGRGMRPHRRVAPYDADVVSSRFQAPKNSYSTLPPTRLFPVLSVLMKNLGIFGPGDEFGSFCPLWLVGVGGGERRCFFHLIFYVWNVQRSLSAAWVDLVVGLPMAYIDEGVPSFHDSLWKSLIVGETFLQGLQWDTSRQNCLMHSIFSIFCAMIFWGFQRVSRILFPGSHQPKLLSYL